MNKIIPTFFVSLLLVGCTSNVMPVSEDLTKENNEAIETIEPTTTPEIVEYSPDIPTDETETTEGENQQVKYKEGEFDWVHDKFFETYSEKEYQSFSRDALLDILVDNQSEMFEDAISFVSNQNYNQFYVFKVSSDEEITHINNFYLSMKGQLENDPVAEGEAVWSFLDQEGKIITIAFGDKEFISEMDTLKNYIYKGNR